MQRLKVIFLLVVLVAAPGYRFRCYWMCTDQTAVQNDYVEQRDRCREYAQLKLDMSMKGTRGPVEDKTRKSHLVNLFSECMGKNGWNVPSGRETKEAIKAPATPATTVGAAALSGAAPYGPLVETVPPSDPYYEQASLSRTTECAFARHGARHSSIAAARAKACDLECAQRMQLAPDAPRPAACPSDADPKLSTGAESEPY